MAFVFTEKEEKILEASKRIVQAIAGIGITMLCGAFTGNIVGSTKSGPFKKNLMAIGGAVLGGMLAKYASDHIDKSVEEAKEATKEIFDSADKVKTAVREKGEE